MLRRADGRGDAWDLPALAEGRAFNGGAVGAAALRPVDSDGGSYRWYPQPHIECKWWAGCNRYDGLPVYVVRFRLPSGFTCDHCVMQWFYQSGHKCHPPCLATDKYYPDCRKNPKVSTAASHGWGCVHQTRVPNHVQSHQTCALTHCELAVCLVTAVCWPLPRHDGRVRRPVRGLP